MAYQHTGYTQPSNPAQRLLNGLKSVAQTVWNALIEASEANRRMKIVQRLNEKSDAELAELGLRREDIVRRVFIDMLHT